MVLSFGQVELLTFRCVGRCCHFGCYSCYWLPAACKHVCRSHATHANKQIHLFSGAMLESYTNRFIILGSHDFRQIKVPNFPCLTSRATHAHEQTKYANSQSAGQFRACRLCAVRLSLTPPDIERLCAHTFLAIECIKVFICC